MRHSCTDFKAIHAISKLVRKFCLLIVDSQVTRIRSFNTNAMLMKFFAFSSSRATSNNRSNNRGSNLLVTTILDSDDKQRVCVPLFDLHRGTLSTQPTNATSASGFWCVHIHVVNQRSTSGTFAGFNNYQPAEPTQEIRISGNNENVDYELWCALGKREKSVRLGQCGLQSTSS